MDYLSTEEILKPFSLQNRLLDTKFNGLCSRAIVYQYYEIVLSLFPGIG
jgi:hypothetical protein